MQQKQQKQCKIVKLFVFAIEKMMFVTTRTKQEQKCSKIDKKVQL